MGLGEHATGPMGFTRYKEKKLLSSWGGFPTVARENCCSEYAVAARGWRPRAGLSQKLEGPSRGVQLGVKEDAV